MILRLAVRRSAAVEKYHGIIIDTQGAAGELQKTAAMTADMILAPFKPDVLSAAEFADGTLRLMVESLNSLSDFGADFRSGELYVVISDLERNNNARQVADQIRWSFADHKQVKGFWRLSYRMPLRGKYARRSSSPYQKTLQSVSSNAPFDHSIDEPS